MNQIDSSSTKVIVLISPNIKVAALRSDRSQRFAVNYGRSRNKSRKIRFSYFYILLLTSPWLFVKWIISIYRSLKFSQFEFSILCIARHDSQRFREGKLWKWFINKQIFSHIKKIETRACGFQSENEKNQVQARFVCCVISWFDLHRDFFISF